MQIQEPKASQRKRKKKTKRPDNRPARARYWRNGGLALKKVRRLVRSGWNPRAAFEYWQKVRKRHYGELPLVRDVDKIKRRGPR